MGMPYVAEQIPAPEYMELIQVRGCTLRNGEGSHEGSRKGSPSCAPSVVRRLGGAYGGKVARSMPVAAAAALAARVTGRCTRLALNRNDDMRMNGGALLLLQKV